MHLCNIQEWQHTSSTLKTSEASNFLSMNSTMKNLNAYMGQKIPSDISSDHWVQHICKMYSWHRCISSPEELYLQEQIEGCTVSILDFNVHILFIFLCIFSFLPTFFLIALQNSHSHKIFLIVLCTSP